MKSHLYFFAHRALTEMAFSDPTRFFRELTGPGGAGFLAAVWAVAGKRCGSARPPEGLRHFVTRVGDETVIACIQPPPPEATAEAHFVAIVGRVDLPGAKAGKVFRSVRFFALEKAAPIDPGVSTYLCEWTNDGVHQNLGPGPEPEEAAFIQALSRALATKGDIPVRESAPAPAAVARRGGGERQAPPIETEERARRLARAIASDLFSFNKEKIVPGIPDDELFATLAEEIEKGRALYKSRVSSDLYQKDIYDQALVDMKAHFTSKTSTIPAARPDPPEPASPPAGAPAPASLRTSARGKVVLAVVVVLGLLVAWIVLGRTSW
jgi:hypothetical protein